MSTPIFERTLGPYRLSIDGDATTHLEHSSIPHRGRITWLEPRLDIKIRGTEVEEPFRWEWYDAREDKLGLGTMECELAGLRIRIRLGFHVIHGVPNRIMSVINVTDRAIEDIEIEISFPMPPDSEFVVLSSSDRIAVLEPEKSGTVLAAIATLPLPIPFRSSLKDGVWTAQINSILLPAARTTLLGKLPGEWGQFLDEHHPGANPDKVLVDGSPAYLFKVPTLAPNHVLAAMAPYFLLRTARDSAGVSGIGFAVHRDDWAGALACVNAPTYLGYSGGVVDHLLGLYSPIEFYDTPSAPDVADCLQRLERETGVSTTFLILPDSFEKDAVEQFQTAVGHAVAGSRVITLPPLRRSLLPAKLSTAVGKLLAAAAAMTPAPPRRLVVSSPALQCDSLYDATTPDSVLCLSNYPVDIAALIHIFHPETVLLPQHAAEQIEADVRATADEREVDLEGVTFRSIDRAPSTSMLWGDAARQAAARCVANAYVSAFQVNDVSLLDQLFTQVVESFRQQAPPKVVEQAEQIRASRDIDALLQVCEIFPDLSVRSVAYSMNGPCALVIGVLTPHRWHDAVIAAQFARAKRLPAMYVTIDDDAAAAAERQLRDIERRQPVRNDSRLADAVTGIGLEWLSPEVRFLLLRLARKSLILFEGGRELPWEFASWSSVVDERPDDCQLLAREFDIGRMTSPQGRQVGRIVHRTLRDSLAPPTVNNRVLLAWDGDIDSFMGRELEDEAVSLLAAGLQVDVLAPPARLNHLYERAPDRPGLRADQCTRPLVLARLAGEYSVIVVALHGDLQVDGEVLLRVEGEPISWAQLPELRSHPIVVLNSCWAGRTTSDETQALVSGLAVQFFGRGAFQIIAPRSPVSGRGALLVTNLVLSYGWTRSAARMLRRARQNAEDDPSTPPSVKLDTYWYIAYGDPTASKMFELDGVWEVEDAVEKLARVMPVLAQFRDDQAGARRAVDLSREQIRQGMDIARRWARRAIGQLERYATSVGLPVLTDVLCAEMKQALERIDRGAKQAETVHARLRSFIDSGKFNFAGARGEEQTD
jgi:hypothetical protein